MPVRRWTGGGWSAARRAVVGIPLLSVLLVVGIAGCGPRAEPAAPPPAARAQDAGAATTVAPGELGRTDVDTEVFVPLPGRLRLPPPDSAIPAPDYAAIRPNELGKVMVLEYHVIGDEELRWTRTRENFRKDLEYLHRHGYHLVGMRDLLEDRVRVPAGKTPVVLTFDDSNRSQFQFIAGPGGQLVVDPTSGLGILEAFIEEHPDFGRAGVFCVLPGADPPNDLFGQPEHRQRKLQYLAGRGYELCNHTLWHALLDRTEAEEIVRQLALTQKAIREAVPGYEVRVFCPPGGAYPDDLAPVLEGTHEGEHYQHWAILEVTGGPMTAPGHRDTDFLHVPRIQAIPDQLKYWFRHFEENPDERYVSDGDPDRVVFPTALAGHIAVDLAAKAATMAEASSDPDYRVLRLR